jgi:hypothetical protein
MTCGGVEPKAGLRHYTEKRARCGTCGEWYLPVNYEQHKHPRPITKPSVTRPAASGSETGTVDHAPTPDEERRTPEATGRHLQTERGEASWSVFEPVSLPPGAGRSPRSSWKGGYR